MTQKKIIFKSMLFILFLFISKNSTAFNFNQSNATAYINAESFPNTLGNITSLASGTASVTANGWPNSISKDTVKINSVTISPDLTLRGFSLEVKVGSSSWVSDTAAVGKCVWVDGSCSTNGSTSTAVNNKATQAVSVRLLRNSTAAYDTIPSGTNIAVISLLQYSTSSPSGSARAYLYFKFDGAITPVIPTCDIKNYDKSVILPDVNRADLVSHGTGRYTGVTKEFNISLACENAPKVSIKFDGDKMLGIASEDVLVNKSSGNDNVGVQLVYDSTALKIGKNVAVINAADENEALKFNAYYYYKGGDVQSGPVKSQSEFLFSYE